MTDPKKTLDSDKNRLQAVSDALSVLVGWMREELASDDGTETFELIRLHTAITDAQGRQRLMNVARREAARCQAGDLSEPATS